MLIRLADACGLRKVVACGLSLRPAGDGEGDLAADAAAGAPAIRTRCFDLGRAVGSGGADAAAAVRAARKWQSTPRRRYWTSERPPPPPPEAPPLAVPTSE